MNTIEEFNAALDVVVAEKTPKQAVAKFGQLLLTLEGKPSQFVLDAVTQIANTISQESITVITAREICVELIIYIDKLSEHMLAISLFEVLLLKMQSRLIAFEVQLTELRDLLGKRYTATCNHRMAASVLSGIPLENGQRPYSVSYKLNIYLRIIESYLTLSDPVLAEVYINRASLLQSECQDQDIIMRFKTSYARLLDFKQKFLEAGQRYAELSIRFSWLDESTKMAFLERALLSALLAGAGQQRARLLATLYKDERCQSLQAYPILVKMYTQRLISRSSLQSLEPLLIQYYPQLFILNKTDQTEAAPIAGLGTSLPALSSSVQAFQNILERVVVEHNMLAASLIYNNITLANLGELLEVETNQAESIAAQMISEGRLVAQIDQIDSVIHFEKKNDSVTSLSSQIQTLCASVNRIVEGIEADHPSWIANHVTS